MWYKIAKQGSLWSRIAPDAEEQFDKLLDEATIIENNDKKIDVKKLNQLFRQSNFKNLVVRFVIDRFFSPSAYYGRLTPWKIRGLGKLSKFEKFIPDFLANRISLNPEYFNNKSYYRQRSILKHELGHAISDITIGLQSANLTGKQEHYTRPERFVNVEIGKNVAETNNRIKALKLREILYDSTFLPTFYKYYIEQLRKENLPFDEDDRLMPELIDPADITRVRIFEQFVNEVKKGTIKIDKTENQQIKKILTDNFKFRQGDLFISEQELEKINKDLYNRSKTTTHIIPVDMYFANPEEKRAIFLQLQDLISKRKLIEYYNYSTPDDKKNDLETKYNYLNHIRKIMDEALRVEYFDDYVVGEALRYEPLKSRSANFYQYCEHFDSTQLYEQLALLSKDENLKKQLAKHMSNVFQDLKNYLINQNDINRQEPIV